MKVPASLPRLKGFRYPREIIAYAVWVYHRFALSMADVEDLLAERSVNVIQEAVLGAFYRDTNGHVKDPLDVLQDFDDGTGVFNSISKVVFKKFEAY